MIRKLKLEGKRINKKIELVNEVKDRMISMGVPENEISLSSLMKALDIYLDDVGKSASEVYSDMINKEDYDFIDEVINNQE